MTSHDDDQTGALHDQAGRKSHILARPPGHLRALPLRYRWETTRRHPYYLVAWENAGRTISANDTTALLMQQAYRLFLGAIGVSGPVISPETPFEALVSESGESPPAWLCGSVQPLSLRGLTGLLLAHLSPATRRQLAELFRASVDGGEDYGDSLTQALLHLLTLESADLDMFADQPIVAISPYSTVHALAADLRHFVDDWRDRHELDEQRVRADRFDEYFAVWDAREGWTGSGYELGDHRRLIDVARRLQISPTTARNRYYSAFELITGHRYSAANWLRIWGPVKFPTDQISEINQAAFRRRMRSGGSRAPTPDAAISPLADRAGITGRIESENDDLAMWVLVDDFQTLLRLGRSDQEIAEELEIHLETVLLLKSRCQELPAAPGIS